MFRAISAKILLGSKKPSKTSMRAGDDQGLPPRPTLRIDLATASKTGKLHANEDRAVVLRRFPSNDDSSSERKPGEFSPPPSPSSATSPSHQQSPTQRLQLSNIKYLAVFDGHGGSQCAAFMRERLHEHILLCIVQTFGTSSTSKLERFEQLKYVLPDAFKAADDEFCEMYPSNTSGACGVIALIHDREVLVAHVGDCRAILRCNGETIPLTRDHRPSNLEEYRRVLASGGTVVDGRVCGILHPSRSFGDTDVRAEFGDGVVISEPDITYVQLETALEVETMLAAGTTEESPKAAARRLGGNHSASSSTSQVIAYTFLLLSSDGVFEYLDHEEACEMIETGLRRFSGDPSRAVERLIKVAAEHSQDDCTVVLAVWVDSSSQDTPTRAKSQRFVLSHRQASTEDDVSTSREETTRDESNVQPFTEDRAEE